MVTNCYQNNHQIRFWLLNNYKIKVMIEFSDQLSLPDLITHIIIEDTN